MNKSTLSLLILVGVILLPYLILGQGVAIPVSDNMDSNLAWYKMLQDQGKIFSSWNTAVQGMLIETPRFSYPSGYNLELLLYFIFPHFLAYIIHKGLLVLIAFYAFRFWLRGQEMMTKGSWKEILFCLIWASLAFYPHRGITIVALPLVIQVVSRFTHGIEKPVDWLLLLGYACYSMLTLAAFYFILGIMGWLLLVSLQKRSLQTNAFLALLAMTCVFLLQEVNLIIGYFFNPDFVSHRSDFTYDFGIWLNQSPWSFFLSGDQNGVYYSPLYAFFLGVFVLIAWLKKDGTKKGFSFLVLLVLISCVLSFLSYSGNLGMLRQLLPRLNSLNLLRFEYWLPFLLFASLIFYWSRIEFKGYKLLLPICLVINVFVYQYEWRYWINSKIPIIEQVVPSYQSYFATAQLEEIKAYLGSDLDGARFANFNFPPAVTAYNGLLSADGYVQLYAKSHKDAVYQVIQAELEKDLSLKAHFLNWGNKCYFQNVQYPDDFVMYKWRKETILQEPNYDFSSFKNELKVNYILSSLPISSDQLTLNKVFEHEHSAWRIHLYQLD